MERGQGEGIGDSGGIETTSASSGNQNGHIIELGADGMSTDGEHFILGQHDDASVWTGERREENTDGNGGAGDDPRLTVRSASLRPTNSSSDLHTLVSSVVSPSAQASGPGRAPSGLRPARRVASSSSLVTAQGGAAVGGHRRAAGSFARHDARLDSPFHRSSSRPNMVPSKPVARTGSKGNLESKPSHPKPKGAPPSTLRPIVTNSSATPIKALTSKVPPGKLPGLAPKAGPGDARRILFQPAQKLDPKQLKVVVRRWYRFDKCGRMSIIEAGKSELTESLGVHSRDLRVLDAQRNNSSYPSCILCREKALVINLEFIQVIVTTDTTLVLNAERASLEPLVQKFVHDLQRRLSRASGLAPVGEDSAEDVALGEEMPDGCGTQGGAALGVAVPARADSTTAPADGLAAESSEADLASVAMAAEMPGSAREAQEAEIPYELRVLEVCLDHVAKTMSEDVRELEAESKMRLDALAQRVTPANLDHVRRVKNRMVRLTTRVDTIRSLLERYLSDDADLAELHLSGQRQVEAERAEKQRLREERRRERLQRYAQRKARYDERQRTGDHTSDSEPSSVSNSTFTISSDDPGWLSSQAEMVIEPYFMSFDNTWNRMQAINEFIDDTEDYVNITLDSHRNQLIQVDLLLTAATFCIGLATLLAGFFGMNLASGMEADRATFVLVAVLSSMLAVALLGGFVLIMRQRQLAFV
eukprot:jgi/Ulvmu1/6929/UM032_0007.1